MYNTNEGIIKEIALEDIKLKIQASFFMLLSNSKMLKGEGYWNIPYKKEEALTKFEYNIFEFITNIDSFFKDTKNTRDTQINSFVKLKKEFLLTAESVYCYFYHSAQLKNIVGNNIKMCLLNEEKQENIATKTIYNSCMEFISKDTPNNLDKIPQLMSVLPVKITSDKYYDYVKNSLNIVFKHADETFVNNLVKNFKLKFLANKMPSYGLYYLELKDKLKTICELNMETLNYEELLEIYESLDDTLEFFSEIEDYLSTIYECINYIIYILTFTPDTSFILEDNLIYKDIFYSCKNFLNNSLEEAANPSLDELLSDTCEALVDSIIDIEKSENQIFDTIQKHELQKETLEILQVQQIITDLYYESLLDAIYPINVTVNNATNLNPKLIEDTINEFLSYINTSLKTLTPTNKRLVKQFFLQNLPTPFNLEEFKTYLNYTLQHTNNYENCIILESLHSLLNETNKHTHKHENSSCGCASK